MFVCLFVCLFAVNAKTTARIDAKRSGITKNDPESVLCCLKSPVLLFLGRYRDISGFSFAADRHFLLIPFHFWLLPRRQKRQNAKTTERIDAKRSGITKKDTESVLRWLKLPVLVLSRRYCDISGFSVVANHHDTKSRLHIFQCMQSLTFV